MPSTRSAGKPSPKTKPSELPVRDPGSKQKGRAWVFYGRAGSGKTTLAGSFPGPILVLDCKDDGDDSVSDVTGLKVMDITETQDLVRKPDWSTWVSELQATVAAGLAKDTELLAADSDPIHPARIYGELIPRLADDATIIGDGGDFVSWAGRFVEPRRPGSWLAPGPYGCLGAGMGAAIAARLHRPSSQVVLLYGDGATGMSLMDVDTLVRHNLPVVMICGNNSAWGLEKQPMQMLYGYDVAADLNPAARYDDVVKALGGAGETVTAPGQIGAAIDRAFAANAPYFINVVTDVNEPYPRNTFGI